MRKIIKLFEKGNVCVFGFTGTGKDTLMGNVIVRRRRPYVSDINYGGDWIEYNYKDFDCGGNTYENFVTGDYKYYEYPFPDGTDLYLPDSGVKYPSQFCNELNKKYPQMSTFLALSRHVGKCHAHWNIQACSRMWDKFRESGDSYIMCVKIRWIGQLVIQRVRIYEKYESAHNRVPVFPLRRPLLNMDRLFQWKMLKTNYLIAHGKIKERTLIYRNRSKHDTRFFKEVLANGKKTY